MASGFAEGIPGLHAAQGSPSLALLEAGADATALTELTEGDGEGFGAGTFSPDRGPAHPNQEVTRTAAKCVRVGVT